MRQLLVRRSDAPIDSVAATFCPSLVSERPGTKLRRAYRSFEVRNDVAIDLVAIVLNCLFDKVQSCETHPTSFSKL